MGNGTADTVSDRASFGELLRRYRTLAGMSQELLAERAGLTSNGIGSLERGARTRPHPHTIHAIAEALNLGNAEHNALIEAASGARARPERPKPERIETPAELPIPPSPLIGRDQAVREVSELLRREDVRLVTLTGIGGVGKTRLALEIAWTSGGAWPDGMIFVSLAALNDPALLISTLARSIGLRDMAGDQVRHQLHARLKSRQLLLVLDNLEHLLPDAAAEVAELLAATDALTILATSRAPLQIRAELEMPVGPLSLGQPAVRGDEGAGTAVELFVLRARDVRPSFELTKANAATIAAICRQLGGLPLAIELAAAWTRVLTPDDLLSRLDHVLTVEGARDLPTRQRTMRATLDWSHSLLSPAEQILFRRLAVFSGGFTLEAAEAICPDEPEGAGEVLEGVGRLVEHSLVSSNTATEPVRYAMLEPVRQYAGEHLATSGEGAWLRGRHAEYFLALAEQAETGLVGPDQAGWLRRFDAEHPNLRSTLRWLMDTGDLERLARLGWHTHQFWITRGHFNEGAGWIEPLLERDDQLSLIGRVYVRYVVAYLRPGQGRMEESVQFLPELSALVRKTGDRHLDAFVHGLAAGLSLYAGDLETARVYADRARDWYDQNPWEWPTLGIRMSDAVQALWRGEPEEALLILDQAADDNRNAGDWWHLMHILNMRSEIAVGQGDVERAAASSREAIVMARHIGTTSALPDSLTLLGTALEVAGNPALAARVLGSVEALRERIGDTMIVASRRRAYDEHIARITTRLGEVAMADTWQAGREAPLDDVIDEALAAFEATRLPMATSGLTDGGAR